MNAFGSYLRGSALLVAGIVIGTLLMGSTNAQENVRTGLRLNHVGIAVKDVQEAVDYYTKVVGFRMAFRFPSSDGRPTTTYLQISRDTFLEIAPASANAPAGTITHIGIETDDADGTVARLRQNGATVTDARVSGNSKSKLANITDPNKIRLELNELIPGALTRQAVESWKE